MKIFANQISTNIREDGVLEIYVKDCLAATVSDGNRTMISFMMFLKEWATKSMRISMSGEQ